MDIVVRSLVWARCTVVVVIRLHNLLVKWWLTLMY
jgi:hypothetical protein